MGSCRPWSPLTQSRGFCPPNPPLTLRIRRRASTSYVSAGAVTRIWPRSSPAWANSMTKTLAGGAERIRDAFEVARQEGRAALMPYMMGGFPDLETAVAVADAYVESGADLVELGVPFSDPLADGPVIHDAGTRALAAGATLHHVLAAGEEIARHVPVVLMCYANPMLARGTERFADELAHRGISGLIVPDLPLEEAPAV